MEITHRRLLRLQVFGTQLMLGTAGLALITVVCFWLGVGVARTGFAYVILIAVVSLMGSLGASVVLSIVAAGCLNYFFAPPLFEFRIDAADDITRIAAFLVTSLVVASLTTRARVSEARFRTFVDHATDGFFLFDEHQALVDVNRKVCESLGYSREEMIGMHPRDFDAALDQASIAQIGKRVSSGETVTFETQHRRKDGTVFPVEVRARQFLHGPHRFRLSLARDITERKRTEELLRENEARLQKAQHIAHFGWWERDFATSRVSLSDEVCRIFGLEAIDLPEWHARWLSLIHTEDQPRVAEAAAAALLPGGPRYDVEYRVIRRDGTERIVHSQGDVTWDESGRPLRQFGVLQDITELRQAEKELRASEGRFRIFVDHATDAFFLLDDDWTILDVNRQASHGLGYSREELIGKHKSDFDIGLDGASIQRQKQRIVAGEAISFETRHRRKDGTSFPVEVRLNQFEQGGRRYLCSVRDISERKRAEDELRESEERFRTLVQFSFDVYWESDAQHRFIRQEFAEGLPDAPPPGSEIGKTRWEVPYLEPDAEAWRKHRETLDAHLPFRDFEIARPAPDGGKRYVSVSGMPIFDKSGGFIGYRGVGRHITERKRVEEALRRSEAYLAEAQRLSHTGTLAFNATAPVYWSEESYRIWGFDPLDGLPDRETVLQRVHPDDRERVNAEVDEALHARRIFELEFRILLPDGTVKYIEFYGRAYVLRAGGTRGGRYAHRCDGTQTSARGARETSPTRGRPRTRQSCEHHGRVGRLASARNSASDRHCPQ